MESRLNGPDDVVALGAGQGLDDVLTVRSPHPDVAGVFITLGPAQQGRGGQRRQERIDCLSASALVYLLMPASALCRSKLTRSPLIKMNPELITCWPVQSYSS